MKNQQSRHISSAEQDPRAKRPASHLHRAPMPNRITPLDVLAIGGPAAIAALAVGHQIHTTQLENRDKMERDAIEAVVEDQAPKHSIVVLHEGVQVRKAPKMTSANAEMGPWGTEAFRVGQGKVIRVDANSNFYEDDNGDRWLSFTLVGDKDADPNNLDDIYWANASRLERESTRGPVRIEYYEPSIATQAVEAVQGAPVLAQAFGTGVQLTESTFLHLAKTEGLQKS